MRLALPALLLLLARKERLDPLPLLELLLVRLRLGLRNGLLLLHKLDGALAAPPLRLGELRRVLRRHALQPERLLTGGLLLGALLRKLRRPLLRELSRLLLRQLRSALLLVELLLGDFDRLLLSLALLLELGQKVVLLSLDGLGVRLRSGLHGRLDLRRELQALHECQGVLVLRGLERSLALRHGVRVGVAHLQRHLEELL